MTIASNISVSNNAYAWNIPTSIPDGSYAVQICERGGSVCDMSDNIFSITTY
jgi:hypothetical protein